MSLSAGIRRHRDAWRAHARWVEALERLSRGRDGAGRLARELAGCALRLRVDLRAQHGLDLRSLRPPGFVLSRRLAWRELWALCWKLRILVVARYALAAAAAGDVPMAIEILCAAPSAVAHLEHLGGGVLRLDAMGSLAGFVASKASLRTNRRLRAALSAEGGDPARELLQRLPGPVTVAWSERGPRDGADDVARRALRALEEERPKAHGEVELGEHLEAPTPDEQRVPTIASRDLARLLALASPAERRLLAALAASSSIAEAAKKLRMRPGTLRVALHRLRWRAM